MTEPFFFEVPIYRCDPHKYEEEETMKRNKYFDQYYHEESISKSELSDIFMRIMWQPWEYNEVIGWIRLYIFGTQIRGEYYFITSKNIRQGLKNKRFEYYGKAFEYSIYDDMPNSEIHQGIIDDLEEQQNEKPLKNRHLDLRAFNTIAKFIDWKSLVKS